MKIGTLVGVHHVIIQSEFDFSIFKGFRSTGGQNFHFPIDFAGLGYNSAAAGNFGYNSAATAAQPAMGYQYSNKNAQQS